MAITISGENNNDRILAADGVIDSLSGFNIVGVITATTFTGDLTGDVTGNLTGNVTGNINNSTLLLQTGGTERVRITSAGKVLIGTSTPQGNANADDLVISTSGHSGITIRSGTSSNGNIFFADGTSGGDEYRGVIDYNHSSNHMSFSTNAVERLRITSTGNVGINQSSPRTTLDVSGYVYLGAGGQLQITGSAGAKGLQLAGADDGTNIIGTMGSSGEHLAFRTASNERMRLLVGGSHLLLGGTASVNEITESSAHAGMVIGGTGFGNAGLAIISSTSGTGRLYFGDSVGGNAARNRGQINYYHNGDYMLFATAGSERLRITNDGKIGINRTPTQHPLEVQHASEPTVSLWRGSTKSAALQAQSGGTYLYSYEGAPLIFSVNSGQGFTRRLHITSGGQILIGGTTSSNTFNGVGGVSNLVVAGSTADTDITDNSGASLTISNTDSTANNTAGLHFAREDTDGAPHYSGASIVAQFKETMNTGQYPKADLAFLTSTANNNAPSEKMRLSADGKVKIGGGAASLALLHIAPTLYGINLQNDSNNKSRILFSKNSAGNDSRAWIEGNGELNGYISLAAGDNERLRIDSTGNMGLGLTPVYSGIFGGAQRTFHIGGTAAPCLRITSSSSGQADLVLHAGNSGRRADIANMATNGYISIWTKPSSGSIQERIKIHPDGYVTKPATPAFFATHTSTSSTHIGTLTYNTSGNGYYNNGGHLDTGTGQFHAPVTGIYHFHFHGFFQTNQSQAAFEVTMVRKNSGGSGAVSLCRQYGYRDQPTNQYGPSISMQLTCSLTAGQTMEVSTAGLSFHGANGYYFGGHLLG